MEVSNSLLGLCWFGLQTGKEAWAKGEAEAGEQSHTVGFVSVGDQETMTSWNPAVAGFLLDSSWFLVQLSL